MKPFLKVIWPSILISSYLIVGMLMMPYYNHLLSEKYEPPMTESQRVVFIWTWPIMLAIKP